MARTAFLSLLLADAVLAWHVARLDSSSYRERVASSEALIRSHPFGLGKVRKAFDEPRSLEQQRRCQLVLAEPLRRACEAAAAARKDWQDAEGQREAWEAKARSLRRKLAEAALPLADDFLAKHWPGVKCPWIWPRDFNLIARERQDADDCLEAEHTAAVNAGESTGGDYTHYRRATRRFVGLLLADGETQERVVGWLREWQAKDIEWVRQHDGK